jgi:hypothetical protein
LCPLSALHSQESRLHSPRRRWSLPCLLTKASWIFTSGEIVGGAIPQIAYLLSCLKWRIQVSSAMTIWDRYVSSPASKCANNQTKGWEGTATNYQAWHKISWITTRYASVLENHI